MWLKLYEPLLQSRQNWCTPRRNLAVGDLVLVIDDCVKRGNWQKALVTEVYLDWEGLVWRVKLGKPHSSIIRDV